jgi:hypothetical protein
LERRTMGLAMPRYFDPSWIEFEESRSAVE